MCGNCTSAGLCVLRTELRGPPSTFRASRGVFDFVEIVTAAHGGSTESLFLVLKAPVSLQRSPAVEAEEVVTLKGVPFVEAKRKGPAAQRGKEGQ